MKFKWPFRSKAKSTPTKRAFAGALGSRLTQDWVTMNTSADAEIRVSLTQLRNRSRQLHRDNDYVKQAFRTIRNNVIGQGIGFQAQVKKLRGTSLDERTNAQIKAAWDEWCKADSCHTAGTLSFNDIERLLVTTLAESGEFIVRKIYQKMGKSKIPFSLEIIEADLLDEGYNGVAENGNEIRMGVEVDKWRRPTAYYFFQNHPGDYQSSSWEVRAGRRVRIPADEIIHRFLADRVSQTRGIPWLSSGILRVHQMQGMEEAEVIGARAAASIMGFIESPEGEAPADGVENGERVVDFEPGVFKYLCDGEKVNVPQLNRPSGQFEPFMRSQLRGFSAGVGASFESISKDYSQSNYSSSRLALIDDRDNWRVLQKWIITGFHSLVYEEWLDWAVFSGVVQIKSYELMPSFYQKCRWLPRGWMWVDPLKEVNAYKEAVRCGFMTQADVIAQSGGDIEDTFSQRAHEIDLANKYGLTFDSDPEEVDGTGKSQMTAVTPDPNAKPDDEDADNESEDDDESDTNGTVN